MEWVAAECPPEENVLSSRFDHEAFPLERIRKGRDVMPRTPAQPMLALVAAATDQRGHPRRNLLCIYKTKQVAQQQVIL
jgi:hypothetical protein